MNSQEKPAENLTLHSLQLREVILEESEAKSFKLAHQPDDAPLQIKLNLETDATPLGGRQFLIRLRVIIQFGEEQTENRPMDLRLSILGRGESSADVTEEQLGAFAATAGPYLLLPYARTYVSSLSQFMGYPPLILPLFQIPKQMLAAEKEQEDS